MKKRILRGAFFYGYFFYRLLFLLAIVFLNKLRAYGLNALTMSTS